MSGTVSRLREVSAVVPSEEPSCALDLRGLSKRYGSVTALDRLSFEVAPGQMFGFVGANGAGKTTTMRIILGVLEPDEGEVLWHGKPIDQQTRRRFGYMPEERGLYPKMRVGRQLSYFARLRGMSSGEAKEAVRRWMDRLDISGRASDRVETLSLGNQQRVQLAAALVHDPEFLVLDEPFSGLDPIGVDALSEVLLERANMGVPVIFSSHQLELVERLCDAVAIVDKGSMVASGKVSELRSAGEDRLLRINVVPRAGSANDTSWVEALSGVEIVVAEASGDLLLSIAGDGDEQSVLDAARRVGDVTHFGLERPTLTEIFREVMDR